MVGAEQLALRHFVADDEQERARRRAAEQLLIRCGLLKNGVDLATYFEAQTGTD